MGEGTHFYWQHHARTHGDGMLSLFDDGAAPAEETVSRGLVLNLDESAMTCALERSVSHPSVLAVAEGSVQLLSDGGMFVGFGAEPYFSRFSAQGEILVDGHLPKDVTSYRAFVADFATVPTTKPAVAVGTAASREPHRLRQLERGHRGGGVAGLFRGQVERLIRRGHGRVGRLRDGRRPRTPPGLTSRWRRWTVLGASSVAQSVVKVS